MSSTCLLQGVRTVSQYELSTVEPKVLALARRGRLYSRYAIIVLLPLIIAVTVAVAAVNHGPVRVYWTLGSLFATLATGMITVSKDRNVLAARAEAVRAR